MPATLLDILHYLRSNYTPEIVRTLALVATLVVIRVLVARLLAANATLPMEEKRRWSVSTRNALFVSGVAGVGLIWASEIQSIAVSMLAFTAAFILATKELIMCTAGGVLRRSADSYGIGDVIEIGAVRGRVMDIGILSTTVMEIGPQHNGHQMTGRALTFPNSMLLSQPLARENFLGDYVVHTVSLAIPYSVPPERGERLLLEAARRHCLHHLDAATRHMAHLEARQLLDTPSVEPRVAIQPKDDKSYLLLLRVAIPAKERHRVEQAVFKEFMFACFPEKRDAPLPGDD